MSAGLKIKKFLDDFECNEEDCREILEEYIRDKQKAEQDNCPRCKKAAIRRRYLNRLRELWGWD